MKTELAEKLVDQNVGRFTMVPVKVCMYFQYDTLFRGYRYFVPFKLDYVSKCNRKHCLIQTVP